MTASVMDMRDEKSSTMYSASRLETMDNSSFLSASRTPVRKIHEAQNKEGYVANMLDLIFQA